MKLRGEGRVGLDRESYVCFLSVLSVAVLPISALPVADLQTGMSVLSVAVLSMSVWVCLGLFGSVMVCSACRRLADRDGLGCSVGISAVLDMAVRDGTLLILFNISACRRLADRYVVCEVGGGAGRDGIVESVLVMLVS